MCYLGAEEIQRLGAAPVAAKGVEHPSALAAIRLLLTGGRKSEILTLKWEHVDLARYALRLPDSKTGAKVIALDAAAAALLARLDRQDGDPYVLLGQQLRRRLHDARHTYASFGAAAGMGLPVLGALLGHKQPGSSDSSRRQGGPPGPLPAAISRQPRLPAGPPRQGANDGRRASVSYELQVRYVQEVLPIAGNQPSPFLDGSCRDQDIHGPDIPTGTPKSTENPSKGLREPFIRVDDAKLRTGSLHLRAFLVRAGSQRHSRCELASDKKADRHFVLPE